MAWGIVTGGSYGPEEEFFRQLAAFSLNLLLIDSRWTDFLTSEGEKSDRNRDSEFEISTFQRPNQDLKDTSKLTEPGLRRGCQSKRQGRSHVRIAKSRGQVGGLRHVRQ